MEKNEMGSFKRRKGGGKFIFWFKRRVDGRGTMKKRWKLGRGVIWKKKKFPPERRKTTNEISGESSQKTLGGVPLTSPRWGQTGGPETFCLRGGGKIEKRRKDHFVGKRPYAGSHKRKERVI